MKILLDLQPLQTETRNRGIGRYTLSLVKNILKMGRGHEYFILLNLAFQDSYDDIFEEFDRLIEKNHILSWRPPIPVNEVNSDNFSRILSAELIRQYAIEKINPDIVYTAQLFDGWVNNFCASIPEHQFDKNSHPILQATTVHDLIPLSMANEYFTTSAYKNWYYRKLKSVKKADLILTISEFTAQEIVDLLSIDRSKIVNCSEDTQDCFKKIEVSTQEKERVFRQFGIQKSYFLYTGGWDVRKNVEQLIIAFSLLPENIRKQHQLVIVFEKRPDKQQYFKSLFKKHRLNEDEIIFTGFVCDADLVILYNLCKLFVFPSLYEGFGLPILEAMRCGAPVIAANNSSIPEVMGLDDALFIPQATHIADKIVQVLTNPPFYQQLLKHSESQHTLFSWKKTANHVLDAFEHHHKQTLKKVQVDASINPQHSVYQQIASIKKLNNTDLSQIALCLNENQYHLKPQHSKRQLFLDVSNFIQSDAKTGIQRVVKSLLPFIIRHFSNSWLIRPVYRTSHGYYHTRLALDRLELEQDDSLQSHSIIDIYPNDVFLGLDFHLELAVYENELDFLSYHHKRGLLIIFLLHDILPATHPEWFSIDMHDKFTQWLKCSHSISHQILCNSQATADELHKWYSNTMKRPHSHWQLPKINRFHLGTDFNSYSDVEGPESNHPLNPDLIKKLNQAEALCALMVGTIEPRKGYELALEAFEHLWSMQHDEMNLIMVGKIGWKMDHFIKKIMCHPELNRRLFFLDKTSDTQLKFLYKKSTFLLSPSFGEGFGLPLIEAAQLGLPLVIRDLPIYREVTQNNATFFSATQAQPLAQALLDWQQLYCAKQLPKSADIPFLSWEQSAAQFIDALDI